MLTKPNLQTAIAAQSDNDWAESGWIGALERVCDAADLAVAHSTRAQLAELGLDEDCIRAGFLVATGVDDPETIDRLLEYTTDATRRLYKSAHQLKGLSRLGQESAQRGRVGEENLRRMLLAMVDDARVVPISLVAHLNRLRAARDAPPEARHALGRLTRQIYAPLASRLGIGQLKWELEDVAFCYLQPDAYHRLATALEQKRRERERYSTEMVRRLEQLLADNGLPGAVSGRPKHIYSIWHKMTQKNLRLEQIHDLQAMRILVHTVDQCYEVLAAVHDTWAHYPDEFADYIATPKANGYRSVHTVIAGLEGREVEIQIRTHEMHGESEVGVAAHWRYKENLSHDRFVMQKIVWLRQLLEWKDNLQDIRVPVDESIYVFTPEGEIIALDKDATPIDFAYAIHSEVGHRTRGALINDKMMPLNTPLATGDRVAIQTVRQGGPSRDWLRADQGYVRSSRARRRIARWFKHDEYEKHVSEGRAMLEKELSRLGLEDIPYEKIARHTHFGRVNDLLAAIASKNYKLSRALAPFKPCDPGPELVAKSPASMAARPPAGQFTVHGVGNLLTHISGCCNPVPGEPIVGYITAGRGVSIHRQGCRNITGLDAERRFRLVEVAWGGGRENYTLQVAIVAYHRNGLLSDITTLAKNRQVDILGANMETNTEHITTITLRLEIPADAKADALLNGFKGVRNVFQVTRY